MKSSPILFSAPMIRALLDGRKTQTRRIMKPQPANDIARAEFPNPEVQGWISSLKHKYGAQTAHFCPYGQPGDLLWVRETWAHTEGGAAYDAAGGIMDAFDPETSYRADGAHLSIRWRSSIHMPRWASRLTLRITDVRVQRLQEISGDDCIAEGAWRVEDRALGRSGEAIHAFQALWESIHGPREWLSNPWVWALTFDVIKANVDDVMRGEA